MLKSNLSCACMHISVTILVQAIGQRGKRTHLLASIVMSRASSSIRRFKECIYALADHATERLIAHGLHIIDAMDAIICAEPSPCNDVCRIVEQATHAAKGRWLPICVAWAMLHSVNFLSSVLFNEPEVFTSSVVLMLLFYSMAML